MRARTLDLGAVDPVPVVEGTLRWLPVRRALDVRGFGVNAYVADAGRDVVEEHEEEPGHQELYVVVRGRAVFRSDDEELEAAAGTLVFYPDADIRRGARATAEGTLVLAIGGNLGLPYAPPAWEHWFLAEPLLAAGEFEKAASVLAAGLGEHPDEPALLLRLAAAEAQAGRHDDAVVHLTRAAGLDRAEVARRAGEEFAAALEPLRSHADWPL